MNKAITLLFTSILILNFGVSRVFAEEETDLFTDDVADSLIDVTSNYNLTDIRYNISKNVVIDSAVSYADQMKFDLVGNRTIGFTGSYYDNTITGLQACNASSYQYQTQSQSVDSALVVEPALYGSLNHSSDHMILNFGINVNSAYSGNVSYTTNTFENTSQACSLIGMDSGDGAIDGATLIAAGYEKKTITYNDGSPNGHVATFYVPGNEQFSFSTDDLSNIIDNIYANVINNLNIDFHYEYILQLTMRNKVMPSYGEVSFDVWLPFLFETYIAEYEGGLNNYALYFKEGDHTYINYNPRFYYTYDNNNVYSNNYTQLYWTDTTNPTWYFESKMYRNYSLLNSYNGINTDALVFNNYLQAANLQSDLQGNLNTTMFLREVNQTMVDKNPNLTLGYKIPARFNSVSQFHLYKYQDSSRLSLFNQLGSFLKTQFNRLVNAIGSLDGEGGGSDTITNIENDYNIDFDTDIRNYIDLVHDRSDDIDLTLPEYNLPSGSGISEFAHVPLETIKIFTDNGLGFMIFLPLIIALLGLVL